MKKVVSVTEVEGEGLVKLLGEKITIFCLNYIYTGILEGVNETCVLLKDPAIVYNMKMCNHWVWMSFMFI